MLICCLKAHVTSQDDCRCDCECDLLHFYSSIYSLLMVMKTAVARGDLTQKVTGVSVSGEMLGLVNTINRMIDQLAIFAAEVKKVAREVGTEGKLGGQAEVGNVEGIWQEITYVLLILLFSFFTFSSLSGLLWIINSGCLSILWLVI